MRTRAILGSIFSASAILIVGWELGGTIHTVPATVSTSQIESATPGASSTPTLVPQPATPQTTTGSQALPNTSTQAAADGTFLGAGTSTPYGEVQVQVTISGGSITGVTAVHLTDADGRSVQISNRAAPVLRQEVLSSQSAKVQMVSGATYTSDGYLSSLQSALDQAGF
ncbi:FMN-binding protein [Glaciibacter superstes]|uniref:FMN-binding protein n=1 Tax=Glaciibacter superstes TaxID=501023 RepID=UPI0024801BF4|nr:FMN-binding protein [Glaciibacter superstes]